MWNKEITLIKKAINGTDDLGQPIIRLSKRKVLATEKSVTNSMLFYGAQFGYKPVFVVLIRWFEYEKESFLKSEKDDFIELQCEELIGDNFEL